jgi:Holliday junction resolvasome RuvABC endonuclease subunit
MEQFRVLGIDLASAQTGWALLRFADGEFTAGECGVVKGAGIVRARKTLSPFELAGRVDALSNTLARLVNDMVFPAFPEETSGVIAIEACAATANVSGALYERGFLWWNLVRTIMAGGYLRDRVVVVSAPPSSVKLWASGRGDANKREMMAAVNDNWGKLVVPDGPEITNHNVADALAVATMGAAKVHCPDGRIIGPGTARALLGVQVSLPLLEQVGHLRLTSPWVVPA